MVEELVTSDGVSKEYLAILAQIEEYCNHSPVFEAEKTSFNKGKIIQCCLDVKVALIQIILCLELVVCVYI